jgi:hypothetical protein
MLLAFMIMLPLDLPTSFHKLFSFLKLLVLQSRNCLFIFLCFWCREPTNNKKMGNDIREIPDFNQNDYHEQLLHLLNVCNRQLKRCRDWKQLSTNLSMIFFTLYIVSLSILLNIDHHSFLHCCLLYGTISFFWVHIDISINMLKENIDTFLTNFSEVCRFLSTTIEFSHSQTVPGKLQIQSLFHSIITEQHEFSVEYENRSYIAHMFK